MFLFLAKDAKPQECHPDWKCLRLDVKAGFWTRVRKNNGRTRPILKVFCWIIFFKSKLGSLQKTSKLRNNIWNHPCNEKGFQQFFWSLEMRKHFNKIKIYTTNSHIVGWFVTLGNPNDWKAAIVLIFNPSQTNWGHKWFFTKLLPNSWYCPFLVEYVHSGYSSWHPPQKITSWPGYEAESFQPNHQRVWGRESWDGHMQFSTSPSARWTLTFYTKQCSPSFQAIKNIVNKCQEDTRRCHPLDWKQLSSLIKALLKMIFLFLRYDILVPWRYFHVFFWCFKSGFDVLKFPSFVCKLRPCLLSISFSLSHPFGLFMHKSICWIGRNCRFTKARILWKKPYA